MPGEECSPLEQSPCNECLPRTRNWVSEVISWILKLNRIGMLQSYVVISMPKNLPLPSEENKLRLRAANSAWFGGSAEDTWMEAPQL